MEHHLPKWHALAAEILARGLIGRPDSPIREALFTTQDGPGQGIDLVPYPGADPAQLEAVKKVCEEWDWGGRKGPDVRIAAPRREPDGSFKPGK
jgi:hypothetical protein